MTMPETKAADPMEALWPRIMAEPNTGCWLWIGTTDKLGYGRLWWEGRPSLAHRVVYNAAKAPIPNGLSLDHLCRNPTCVNPDHLEPVTHKVNVLRGEGFGAKNKRKMHCDNGHPFTEVNTIERTDGSGWRACRTCRNAANAAYHQRKIAAQGIKSNADPRCESPSDCKARGRGLCRRCNMRSGAWKR